MIIGGKRNCGKTTTLIKTAAMVDAYILCADRSRSKMIYSMANKMGVKIRFPIIPQEVPMEDYRRFDILVDDVEDVLTRFIGQAPATMTTSHQMAELGKEEQ